MHEESFFADPRMWVVIAFFLFFILFGKKLWGALAGMLDARAVAVKAELEEASRLRREAESMLRDAEKQRADALADQPLKPRLPPSGGSRWRWTALARPRKPQWPMSGWRRWMWRRRLRVRFCSRT